MSAPVFEVDDDVIYAAKFLRSICDFSKESADRVGRVMAISDTSGRQLVEVKWNDDPENHAHVMGSNLWHARRKHLEPR